MEEQQLHETDSQVVYVDSEIIFKVPNNLKFIKKTASPGTGTMACFSKPDGSKVAVKKVTDVLQHMHDAKNTLQEIKLMRKFKHPNLLPIQDIFPPEWPTLGDIYFVCEFMDTDLHRVIYSKQQLTEHHHQHLCCQMLCGLRYLHAADVVHYDLKPANLLVSKYCDLKICEFTKARRVGRNIAGIDSVYVVCHWYWSPESMLANSECRPSMDIWSVGCILCELIGRKPAFKGKDIWDQLKKIFGIVGSPSQADLDWLPGKCAARSFMSKIGNFIKQPWSVLYPQVSTSAHEALGAMLTFHPHHRIDAVAALGLKYFETVYEQRLIVVNCDDSDSKHVHCTTLGGNSIGSFSVPEGEQTFDSWLAKKVVAANPGMKGTLKMVNPAGEVCCSRHFEEGQESIEPIEEPVVWISETPSLTKQLLQTEIYRECCKFQPWIADRDKQQLRDLDIALSGSEQD